MWLIVGLGNPGREYINHRHNIGFHLVDRLWPIGAAEKKRFHAFSAETTIANHKILLLKPQTFMNNSGNAVSEAVNFYKLKPEQVIVFHDELDLTLARFRCKLGGGHAGHNGLRSIQAHIGPNFVRGRLGIGHPGDKALVHSHVLSDFYKSELGAVEAMLTACVSALPLLLSGEREAYQNEVMRLAPAPKITNIKPD